jgi:hypothetical protein
MPMPGKLECSSALADALTDEFWLSLESHT